MLDKSLPHGTVHSQPGVAYYQNGKHYNAEGLEVNFATGERIEKIAPPAPKEHEDPDENQQNGEGAENPDDPTADVVAKNGVNLSAWARGETPDVSIAKVKNAVEDVFGRRPKNGDQALAIIRGEETE